MDNVRVALYDEFKQLYPGIDVYFRPFSNQQLVYPCVVYDVVEYDAIYASGTPYHKTITFRITILQLLPGLDISSQDILNLHGSSHERSFVNDGVVHDIFQITRQLS